MVHIFFKTGFVMMSPAMAVVYWWNNIKNPSQEEIVSDHNSPWLGDF